MSPRLHLLAAGPPVHRRLRRPKLLLILHLAANSNLSSSVVDVAVRKIAAQIYWCTYLASYMSTGLIDQLGHLFFSEQDQLGHLMLCYYRKCLFCLI
jgi:hypothetical protein